jgi:membrane protein YdbS with pleckstrin-like domain
MPCPKCGRETPPDSSYCPGCGSALNPTAATAQSAASPPRAQGRGAPPNEDEVWSGSYSAKAMVGTFIAAGTLTLLAAVVGIFLGPGMLIVFAVAVVAWAALGLLYLYRRHTVRYRLTTYRFFQESGLISRTSDRVEVIDIDDVTVQQGPIERMFGVGTLRVLSSDKTHNELLLPGIDNARHVADLIDSARRAERQRRGLHIDSPISES